MAKLDLEKLVRSWRRKTTPRERERYTIRKHRVRIRYYEDTQQAYVVLSFIVKKFGGSEYRVAFGFPLDGSNSLRRMLSKKGARVGCTCPDFLYRQAYLYYKNDIIYPKQGWGLAATQPPEKTNPRREMRACKHILMVWELIKDKKFTQMYAKPFQREIYFQ